MTDRGTPGPPATPGTPGTSGTAGPPAGSALADLRARVSVEVAKVVVGQQPVVDAMLTSMAVGGHLLLEGA
ncbi:MAG TPA: hypothetical protein VK283_03580, partial [Acidimicrobiales bacterium]|nr:hypothetical protein [Acidimicrobiales bacterium]